MASVVMILLRLVRKGDVVYTHDRDGNVLSEQGLRYEAEYRYNGDNRMVYAEVTSHAEKSRSVSYYEYDGLGRRTITAGQGGAAVRTLYDGKGFEVIREGETFRDGSFTTRYAAGAATGGVTVTRRNGNNQATGERYRWISEGTEVRSSADGYTTRTSLLDGAGVTLYGKGEAVAISRSIGTRSGMRYLGKDILGSVRSVTAETGILDDRYEYDAFGTPYQGDLANGMNLGYTGKPYDAATGLYNYGYRDYRPETARFTTIDPIRDGNNWFAYVNNDPVNYVDLWGLSGSDKTTKPSGGSFPQIMKNLDIVTPLFGDIFVQFELDMVAVFGFEIAISAVFDLDHPLQSGINFSGGWAVGANIGISGGVGYVRNDIEGLTPLTVDANIGPGSVTLYTDDKGINGGSGSLGLGTGISTSSQKSFTISPQAIIDWLFK